MESLWTFLTNPTPNATIIVIVALVLVIPNIDKISQYIPILKRQKKISDVQDEKYPELEKILGRIEKSHEDIKKRQEYISTFQTNHRLHEIIDIKNMVNKIDGKIDVLIEKQSDHGERISRIEGKLE